MFFYIFLTGNKSYEKTEANNEMILLTSIAFGVKAWYTVAYSFVFYTSAVVQKKKRKKNLNEWCLLQTSTQLFYEIT